MAFLGGCRFTKLPTFKLEQSLDSANSSAVDVLSKAPNKKFTIGADADMKETLTPATDSIAEKIKTTTLREMVAEYTGVREDDIPQDGLLSDLGLDSLASAEMAEELSSKFGVEITAEKLTTSTLKDLVLRLNASGPSLGISKVTQPPQDRLTGSNVKEERSIKTQRHQQIFQLLAEVSEASIEDIEERHTLADLGVDSLSLVDFSQELEERFGSQSHGNQLTLNYTVKDLLKMLHIAGSDQSATQWSGEPVLTFGKEPNFVARQATRVVLPNPFDALKWSENGFEDLADKRGFLRYWSDAAPFQDKLLLAYILESFRTLGVDVAHIPPGSEVPQILYLSKYDRLVQRLWEILESYDVVRTQSGNRVRGRGPTVTLSSQLCETFKAKYPKYRVEAEVMSLTGPKLADCLSGKSDAVSIMFGSPASLKIMENFYSQSPMMSTLTDQLILFLTALLRNVRTKHETPVRILEVGAGTGGTSMRLVKALEACGAIVRYTFTDISPSFVSKAKNKLKQYPWVECATFNLENEVPDNYRSQFDILIRANCVHATTNRTASCCRLRETLAPGGFIVLSEVTRVINWYEICFGLLDGWWLAEGGTAYPLQPAESWMSAFKAAGFGSTSYSQGCTAESNTQQLLVGCNKYWDVPMSISAKMCRISSPDGSYSLETMVYKDVGGVQIHADVFLPREAVKRPMPVGTCPADASSDSFAILLTDVSLTALMIHGGRHVALSRKAIRPAQTQHILANGVLPISIDYRLCPEVNLIEGPIADVYDAYQWVRAGLPQMALRHGVVVDSNKVVTIGWSTGGHLTMSIGWNAKKASVPPPTAVLSFYAPLDFESVGK